LFILVRPSFAEDRQTESVQSARQKIAQIKVAVQMTTPAVRNPAWKGQLAAIGNDLKKASEDKAGRYVWFDKAVEDFASRSGANAVLVLDQIDARLALIEDGLAARNQLDPSRAAQDVRKLLPESAPPAEEPKKPPEEPKRNRQEPHEIEVRGSSGGGTSLSIPAGFGMLGWLVIGGLFVACIAVAVILFIQERRRRPKVEIKKTMGEKKTSPEESEVQPDQIAPAALWQQADELARQGQFLEAVRRLYLAVLALLHRSRLIRYEKTRTNGEYLKQVRRAAEAPPAVYPAFGRLTSLFDQKWYGDRSCDEPEYGACRELAEQVRAEVKA
jgi:hypothetical protein